MESLSNTLNTNKPGNEIRDTVQIGIAIEEKNTFL